MWARVRVLWVAGTIGASNAFIAGGGCINCHRQLAAASPSRASSFSSHGSSSTSGCFLSVPSAIVGRISGGDRSAGSSSTTSLAMNLKRPGKFEEPGKEEPLMNAQITCPEVRVVLARPEGDEQIGILPIQQALERAAQLEYDLVMISPTAEPPVCKIIDYGKFRYLSEKKKKDNRKSAKANEVKEVKMSYKIEDHDYQVRLRNAQKFISAGNRVKFLVQFRGREQQHMDLGNTLLKKVIEDCEGVGVAEDPVPKRQGNTLILFMSPKKSA